MHPCEARPGWGRRLYAANPNTEEATSVHTRSAATRLIGTWNACAASLRLLSALNLLFPVFIAFCERMPLANESFGLPNCVYAGVVCASALTSPLVASLVLQCC